ncbi:hypothetical protein P280DRAFT_200129 [Massarina eburnea CBS 473.64]|uniref:Uncharacterized protein n=1 Tax=Massarina eburnea CBS 473.64 TaxID=1395130 RepID=A0A6A6RKZ2_9PLEO|nr:hypothetical protein P280DRAFT_200129 [Massarina eburnea CBS 473.64]
MCSVHHHHHHYHHHPTAYLYSHKPSPSHHRLLVTHYYQSQRPAMTCSEIRLRESAEAVVFRRSSEEGWLEHVGVGRENASCRPSVGPFGKVGSANVGGRCCDGVMCGFLCGRAYDADETSLGGRWCDIGGRHASRIARINNGDHEDEEMCGFER